jgi:hypothetical protein
MIIIPGHPATLVETSHSRELNRRVDDVIRDYRRDHPDVTDADVSAALMRSAPGRLAPDAARRRRAVAIGVSAALVGMFTAVAQGGGKLNNQTWLLVCGVVAVVGAVAIAAIRLARRD